MTILKSPLLDPPNRGNWFKQNRSEFTLLRKITFPNDFNIIRYDDERPTLGMPHCRARSRRNQKSARNTEKAIARVNSNHQI
jgi:hypothetical protein